MTLFLVLLHCSKPFPDFKFPLLFLVSDLPSTGQGVSLVFNGENFSQGGSIDLGTTRIRKALSAQISVQNSGSENIENWKLEFSGSGSEYYKWESSQNIIPANGSIALNISFLPLAVNERFTNELKITSNGTVQTWTVFAKSIPDLYFFVSRDSFTGNLGGVTGADTHCANQKTLHFPTLPAATYRAMVVSDTRRACTTGNCSGGSAESLNWVLLPSREYYRAENDALLFQTNANGIVSFPLTQAWDTSNTKFWWTGLDSNWTNAFDNCTNWSSANLILNGTRGRGSVTSTEAISQNLELGNTCDQAFFLVCVEQVP